MAGWAYQSVSFYLGRCSLQRHCNSHFIGRHVKKRESAFHFLPLTGRVWSVTTFETSLSASYFTLDPHCGLGLG